jgi:hypothetical protein
MRRTNMMKRRSLTEKLMNKERPRLGTKDY